MEKEINVLILDDEENILQALRRLFFKEDFSVFTTSNYQDALKILGEEKIKVVLSDQRMPEINGVDFLKQVKDEFPDAVRILITGHADIQSAEDAINVGGVYRFVNKPWNAQELKGAVRQAIHHYDLVAENRYLFEAAKSKNKELEILNRKLKNMYEIQKEFSSTVSHELRTPLASIKSTVDIVLDGAPGPLTADQKKFLTKTKSNIERLRRLITDILDLTKLESGNARLNIEFNNLIHVIREDFDLHQHAAQKKGLTLKEELPDNIPEFPFDVDKMHQVFHNLMNNAVKFTDQGEIVLSCAYHADKNHVEVCIRDTGPGISKEDMSKLFQKFQQLGDSRHHVGGTGLGLAICKEIINRHGGKIWVESEAGIGSAFKFVLPIQERRKESG